MKVTRIVPSGYCKGVINAINLVHKAKEEHPNEKIYVLGMIVHNSFVTSELDKLGIVTLEDKNKTKEELLDQIKKGVVIFTAHGISEKIKNKAIKKGLTVIDASCEDVLKTREIIKEKLKEGYDVLYYGKKAHPEAEAILSISDKIHLLTSKKDIETLSIENNKIFMTNQTTMSFMETEELFTEVKKKYPQVLLQKEICNATSSRQQAVYKAQGEVLYVVGDTKSNNTAKLSEIGRKNFKKVFLISDQSQIDKEDLKDVKEVYVSAGASTPPVLIQNVIDYLSSL